MFDSCVERIIKDAERHVTDLQNISKERDELKRRVETQAQAVIDADRKLEAMQRAHLTGTQALRDEIVRYAHALGEARAAKPKTVFGYEPSMAELIQQLEAERRCSQAFRMERDQARAERDRLKAKEPKNPRYASNCRRCKFVCWLGEWDVYLHHGEVNPVVIRHKDREWAIRNNGEPTYADTPESAKPVLQEALALVKSKGLIS